MKIGFIGTGNMGSAIIFGLIKSKIIEKNNINFFELNNEKAKEIKEKFEINKFDSEVELVDNSDVIILAIKPNIYDIVLEKIKNNINNKIILTIAAGYEISKVENIIGEDKKIVRTMPNTPTNVLEGMTAVTFNKNINCDEKEKIFEILKSFGEVEEIEEKLMHIFTGVSGSSPAYVYMFIEAMADAAVLGGLSREKAYKIVSQAILGSAKMVLETKKHPAILKDEVTSPGGTTIEAVKTLEEKNFRGTIIDAVLECEKKSKKMSK